MINHLLWCLVFWSRGEDFGVGGVTRGRNCAFPLLSLIFLCFSLTIYTVGGWWSCLVLFLLSARSGRAFSGACRSRPTLYRAEHHTPMGRVLRSCALEPVSGRGPSLMSWQPPHAFSHNFHPPHIHGAGHGLQEMRGRQPGQQPRGCGWQQAFGDLVVTPSPPTIIISALRSSASS